MRSTIFLLPLLSTFALGKSDAILLEKNAPNILDGWSFEAGVAFITKNNIGEIFSGEITRDTGEAGGELYQFTATKHLASLQWEIFGETFTPLLELPLCLEIVDENSRDPFLDYNASLQLRWIDFPLERFHHNLLRRRPRSFVFLENLPHGSPTPSRRRTLASQVQSADSSVLRPACISRPRAHFLPRSPIRRLSHL